MLACYQLGAPDEQPLISAISAAERTSVTMIDPRQPSRLEKKKNMRCLQQGSCLAGSAWLCGDALDSTLSGQLLETE
jgi:hypothetical protein